MKHSPRLIRTPAQTGFSLIELLVVVTIIVILSSGIAMMSNSKHGADLKGGVGIAASLFQEARELAMTRNTNTRLMIYADKTDPTRYGRYMVVLYQDVDQTSGSVVWDMSLTAKALPIGIFFDESLSYVSGSSSSPQVVLFDLKTMTEGTGARWLVYDFTSNGTCSEPGSRFILAGGVINPNTGTLNIPNANIRDGFIIERVGSAVHYTNPDQLLSSNNSL